MISTIIYSLIMVFYQYEATLFVGSYIYICSKNFNNFCVNTISDQEDNFQKKIYIVEADDTSKRL